MGRGRRQVALAMALVVLLGAFTGPYLSSAQPIKTSVTLTLTPGTGYIDPGKDSSSVTFTGKVTVKSIPLLVTNVNITADTGVWANETSVPNLVITGSKDQTFTVKVFAPYNASAGDSQALLVTIKWTNTLNEKGTAEAQAQAVVNQSYKINLWVTSTLYIYPGKSGSAMAYISNAGNGPDTISVKFTNNTDLMSAGWTFSLSKNSLDLDQDGSGTVQVTVNVPATAQVKVYKFQVRAMSGTANDNGKDIHSDTNVTVSVKSSGGGGGGGGNTTQNKSKPVCAWGLIPAAVLVPIGTVFCGVRAVRARRPGEQV
jgi:hypothetical protein